MQNEGIKLMMVNEASDGAIRCGITSRYFKRISRIPSKEYIIPEIEKLKPDVVVLDMSLFEKIGGIETMHTIRDQFDINVWYE